MDRYKHEHQNRKHTKNDRSYEADQNRKHSTKFYTSLEDEMCQRLN